MSELFPWLPVSENLSSFSLPIVNHSMDPDEDTEKNTRGLTTIDVACELFTRSRRPVYTGRKGEGDTLSNNTAGCMMVELSLSKIVVEEIVEAFGVISQAFSRHRGVHNVDSYLLEDAMNLERFIENIQETESSDSIEVSFVYSPIDNNMASKSRTMSSQTADDTDTPHNSVESLEAMTFSDIINSSSIWNEDLGHTDKSTAGPQGASARKDIGLISRLWGKGRPRPSSIFHEARCSHGVSTGALGLSTTPRSAVSSESFTHSPQIATATSHECQAELIVKPEFSARRLKPSVSFLRRWHASSRKQSEPAPTESKIVKRSDMIALADSTEITTGTNSTSDTRREPIHDSKPTDVSSLGSSSTEAFGSRSKKKNSASVARHICDKVQLSNGVLNYVRRSKRKEGDAGSCAPSAESMEDTFSFASSSHVDRIGFTGDSDPSKQNDDLKPKANQNMGKKWMSRLRSKERRRSGKNRQKGSNAKAGEVLDSKFSEWIKHVVLSDDDSSSHDDWVEDTTLVDFSHSRSNRIRGITFLDSSRRNGIMKDGGEAALLFTSSSGAHSAPMGPALATVGAGEHANGGMVRTESEPPSPFQHYLFIQSMRATSQRSPKRVQSFS